MDNFMDKLAQRFNAQEIIKANSHAEAQEMGRLREQLRAYEEGLQEMRRLNLKNVETAEQVHTLTAQLSELAGKSLAALQEERGRDNEKLDTALTELKAVLEELRQAAAENDQRTAEAQEKLLAAGNGLEEFVHKECVKVYRNVQAVLTDELKNQSKELTDQLAAKPRSRAGLYVLLTLTLLTSLGNLGILLARLFGVL